MRWTFAAIFTMFLAVQPALAQEHLFSGPAILTPFVCASDGKASSQFVNSNHELILSAQVLNQGNADQAGAVVDRANGVFLQSLDVFLQDSPCTNVFFTMFADDSQTGDQIFIGTALCAVQQRALGNGITQYHIVPMDLGQPKPPRIIQGYVYLISNSSSDQKISIQRVVLNGRRVVANPIPASGCQF